MSTSQLIRHLQEMLELHGDLPVLHGSNGGVADTTLVEFLDEPESEPVIVIN
jgi:predicted ATPase